MVAHEQLKGLVRGLGVAWLVTTVAGVRAAMSASTGKPGSFTWRDLLAAATPYIFLVGLLVALAYGIHKILGLWLGPGGSTTVWKDYAAQTAAWLSPYRLLVPFLLSVALAAFFSWRIDVNLFAFHMFYRNRLVRCYLGASNPKRVPAPVHRIRRRGLAGAEGPSPPSLSPDQRRHEPHQGHPAGVAGAKGRLVHSEPALLRVRVEGRRSVDRHLPAHRGLPRGREHRAKTARGEGSGAPRPPAGRRARCRRDELGSRGRAGGVRRGHQPQSGLSLLSPGRLPDDRVQRATRLVAPESRQAPEVAHRGAAVGNHVSPLGAAGDRRRDLPVRLHQRRRPLREPRAVRAGAAPLPLHRRVRCGHGPRVRVRRPRQRHPEVQGGPGGLDRHRHAAAPTRPVDRARLRSLRGGHHPIRAHQRRDGRRVPPVHQALPHRERARGRSAVPLRARGVPPREHVGPVVRRVTVRELPAARLSQRQGGVRGRRRVRPAAAGAHVRGAQGALVSAEPRGQGFLFPACRPLEHPPGRAAPRRRAFASWTARSIPSGASS